MIDLNKVKSVHFIGIGGIGMSALARMMLGRHWQKKVSGSDQSPSHIIEELERLGALISIGHAAESLAQEVDLVVYAIAIPEDNPELYEAKRRGIPTLTYPELLGLVSKDYYTIAISGTHGKTTTTGMVAQVLRDGGLEPTVVIGSLLRDQEQKGSNFIAGVGKYFVVEACEYQRSFLNLDPTILVITNIDNDHLDYYKDIADIQSAFRELAKKVPEEGFVVTNPKDSFIKEAVLDIRAKVIDYTKFVQMPPLKLQVPGMHNQLNAAAALAVADILKIPKVEAEAALKHFPGTWRRFEYKGKTVNGALIYDDYGHHPTEIKATLKAAREQFPKQKIVVAFQPHLYSRTKLLFNDFAKSFSNADEVLLAPIYAAREPNDPDISSGLLAEKIKKEGKNATAFENFNILTEHLLQRISSDQVIITLGAGDIFKVGDALLNK